MGNPDVPEAMPSIVREFETVQLGDARLHQRVRAVVARLSVLPSRLLDGRKIRLRDGHHRAGSPLTAIAARRCAG
jgi:hypothetical protein